MNGLQSQHAKQGIPNIHLPRKTAKLLLWILSHFQVGLKLLLEQLGFLCYVLEVSTAYGVLHILLTHNTAYK